MDVHEYAANNMKAFAEGLISEDAFWVAVANAEYFCDEEEFDESSC